MNEKQFLGMMNASPEKRYKSFLTAAADLEEVWLLSSEDGYATADIEGNIHLMIWPHKEFAEAFQEENEEIISMEVHEFVEMCETSEEDMRFMVFPTDKDCYIVDAEQLINDIRESLEEVE